MVDAVPDLDTDLVMTREAYRSWVLAQPSGRFERVEGRVVRMSAERASHADRKALAWLALRQAILAAGLSCHVYPDGMTVETGESDYEPDAVVRCGGPLPDDAIAVPDPVIIVEVLSPSTRHVDLTRKMAGYFLLPSLRHYLIFWADEPRVVHHRRPEGGADIQTRIVTAGTLVLDPPGMTMTLEEVYPG